MPNKSLTLTIVIPVYNEEGYLAACLDSIANQSVRPDEVIVVDNNSTDDSVSIARRYGFVRVVKEPRQHQVFAQSAGFEAARSRILGRIDADTVLPTDWVEKIKAAFADDNLVAVSGGATPYDVPLKPIGLAVFYCYNFLYGMAAGSKMMFGGNCAIKKDAWEKIKDEVYYRTDIWEDFDMSFCLRKIGDVRYLRHIAVGVSFRSVHKPFRKQVSYQFRVVRTFYLRTNLLRTFGATLLWLSLFLVYPLTVIDHWLLAKR